MLPFVVAFTLLVCSTVFAVDLTMMDFNITIPANSSCVAYSTGWTQSGDELVYDPEANTNRSIYPLEVAAAATGICLHGKFESAVLYIIETYELDLRSSTGQNNQARSFNDSTTVCITTPNLNTYNFVI
jgi:hypothetical protein